MPDEEPTEIYGKAQGEEPAPEMEGIRNFLSSRFPLPLSALWFRFLLGFAAILSIWDVGILGTMIYHNLKGGHVTGWYIPFLVLLLIWILLGLTYLLARRGRKKRREEARDLILKAVREQRDTGKVNLSSLTRDSNLSEGELHEILLSLVDKGLIKENLNLQ